MPGVWTITSPAPASALSRRVSSSEKDAPGSCFRVMSGYPPAMATGGVTPKGSKIALGAQQVALASGTQTRAQQATLTQSDAGARGERTDFGFGMLCEDQSHGRLFAQPSP